MNKNDADKNDSSRTKPKSKECQRSIVFHQRIAKFMRLLFPQLILVGLLQKFDDLRIGNIRHFGLWIVSGTINQHQLR